MSMLDDEKLDDLCGDCGQAFSEFLHEMAEQNSKVAACPRCGKPHLHQKPEPEQPLAV
jgi:hypothetical protein